MFGKKHPSDGGARGWGREQSVRAYVCTLVCVLTLFVGEEYVKGRRVGVTGVQTTLCSHKFVCVVTGQVGSLFPVG